MLTVAASRVETQSHSMLPFSVRTRSARWPIAKPALIPIKPVSYSWKLFMWLCDNSPSVVQVCPGRHVLPLFLTDHALLSGRALSGYRVPQAVQM